jgi:hypothetical protein
MEAAGALGRDSPLGHLEAIRAALRARSRVFWIVAGATALAAVLRFVTLGTQGYHHDEIVTASRILRGDFIHAMEAVGFSESAPPLYYALAWAWTQLAGTGEVGLRSFSALAGAAIVPVAYLLGAELSKPRSAVPYPDDTGERNSAACWTGLVAAALVAVNPMLLWYSQEARGYSLLVLFTAAAALYFVRALRPAGDGTSAGRRRDMTLWGVFSALALATHYFAIFPIALEALWLLGRRGRQALAGIWIVVLAGLALAPLAIYQMSLGHAEWIGDHNLGQRLWETGVAFAVGETGHIVARPEAVLPAVVPLLAALAGLALLAVRGEPRERRAGGLMLAVAAATVVVPLALALLVPGKDYVLARNLIPALAPLAARRRGPRLGAGRLLARLQPLGELLAEPAPARLGGGRGAHGGVRDAAGDRPLDPGSGIAALLPLDRLLPGAALRRLRMERARGQLRLRRPGAAGSRPPARPALPPGRLRAHRPPAPEALRAARPRPGAPAPAQGAPGRAQLSQQWSLDRRNRPAVTRVACASRRPRSATRVTGGLGLSSAGIRLHPQRGDGMSKIKANQAADLYSTARENPYVQRLIEDEELRDNLRDAFEAARGAYGRATGNGKGAVKAVTSDKKVQKDLRTAAESLRDASEQLQGKRKRKKSRLGRILLLGIVAAGIALVLSEDARKKVLDALFGAEEEFEYTSTTSINGS